MEEARAESRGERRAYLLRRIATSGDGSRRLLRSNFVGNRATFLALGRVHGWESREKSSLMDRYVEAGGLFGGNSRGRLLANVEGIYHFSQRRASLCGRR